MSVVSVDFGVGDVEWCGHDEVLSLREESKLALPHTTTIIYY